jgi:hypothetical protein
MKNGIPDGVAGKQQACNGLPAAGLLLADLLRVETDLSRRDSGRRCRRHRHAPGGSDSEIG